MNTLVTLTRVPKSIKTFIQVAFDTTIISGMLFLLAINLDVPNIGQDLYLILGAACCFTLLAYSFNIYQSFVRFFALSNMVKILILVSALYIVVFIVGMYGIEDLHILFASCLTTFSLLVLPRVILRELLGTVSSVNKSTVAVLGNGFESYELFELLKRSKKFQPRFFLRDDLDILRVPMTSFTQVPLSKFINNHIKYKIDLVGIPNSLLDKNQTNQAIELLEPLGIPLLKSSGVDNLFNSTAKDLSLVPLSLNDLTFRESQPPIQKLINRSVLGKTVLVTGGGGSIGSELCRQILIGNPKNLIVLDCSEYNLYQIEQNLNAATSSETSKVDIHFTLCSVRDDIGLSTVFENHDIEVVYHAAAFKHVPLVETNPLVSFDNNVLGTKLICELAIKFKVPAFTLISTDKAVNPTNFMGVTKRLAELLCQAFNYNQSVTKFSIVRFGNVLGSSGSVIPKFEKQIKYGGPITVTHPDITRYFMSITEAAQLVIQASAMAKGGDVFVLDMGEPIKIIELAKRLCSLRGLTSFCIAEGTDFGDIEIKITGLRVAEKLFEELLVNNNAKATEHPRIFSAQEDPPDLEKLSRRLDQLCTSIQHKEEQNIQKILSQIAGLNYPIKNLLEFCSRFNQPNNIGAVPDNLRTGYNVKHEKKPFKSL